MKKSDEPHLHLQQISVNCEKDSRTSRRSKIHQKQNVVYNFYGIYQSFNVDFKNANKM